MNMKRAFLLMLLSATIAVFAQEVTPVPSSEQTPDTVIVYSDIPPIQAKEEVAPVSVSDEFPIPIPQPYIELDPVVTTIPEQTPAASPTDNSPLVMVEGSPFPKDVIGWQSIRWGMTVEEVQKAFPKATRLKKMRHQFGTPKDEVIILETKDYMIGEIPYDISYTFSTSRPYKLKAITLVYSTELKGYKISFDETQTILIQKYGSPATGRGLENQGAGSFYNVNKNAVWIFPSCSITLTSGTMTGMFAPRDYISLTYRAISAGGGVAAGF